MCHLYLISVIGENTLIFLQRLVAVFSKLKIKIKQMSLLTVDEKLMHANLMVYTDEKSLRKLTTQMGKIVELIEVKNYRLG